MQPYLGMIFLFGGNFSISSFQMCNGQTLSISQNTALFSILGTYYGGNGVNTFQLPDLRGRFPNHQGTGLGQPTYVVGEIGGNTAATILINNLPQHNHTFNVFNGTSTTGIPAANTYLARGQESGNPPNLSYEKMYATTTANLAIGSQTIGITGGSQPLQIMNPYLTVTYLIAMVGIFPSRN
jgi:microcystin-dependent protein